MAYSTTKLLSLVLFLALISQGYSDCSLKDIHVSQFLPGAKVEGKPEWQVNVSSMCSCAQSLTLNCTGFQSVIPINPSVLKVSTTSGTCLVNAGRRISATVVKFNYAWDQPFQLNPIHVEPCS
ncbi:uncharacterized protein LOC109807438 [Cajanus cajan]|uniref:Protein TAPETUM DETERMINANT 1 n=1 Tax=Cajanus cajan TaxID=3821 RepID=A0A151SMN9_CAJCA|nr:uncharacterized protein LOC109807438 [Cajanus cajan]KYP56028.1 hypothetical protein KK1_002255 [Cajanus cajan]